MTIAPNAAQIICSLGLGDRIVGVSKYCVQVPELAGRPRVGGFFDPNLEKLAALRPDLVVLRGRNDAIEKLCTLRHIALYRDRTETLDDVVRNVREMGRLLDREVEANALAKRFTARLDEVRRRYLSTRRPRVFVTISRRPGELAGILTAGRGTFVDEMIRIAGGDNVFGHIEMKYPQVSPEEILARRPEIIIELMPERHGQGDLARRVLGEWTALDSIPAVRAGRVHVITHAGALIPSLQYIEIIEQVARLLHDHVEVDRQATLSDRGQGG